MKRSYIFLLVAFVLLSNLALAQEKKSMLWRVTDPASGTESYLFGSTSFPDKRVFTFNDSLPVLLKKASVYAPQIVMNAENMQEIANVMLLPDGKDLASVLSPDQLLLVKEKTEKAVKESFAQYARFKPFALMNTVMFARQSGDSKVVLNNHLQNIAEKNGKEMMSLETVAGQLKFWELLSDEAAVAYFERPDYYHVQQKLALEAYLQKDLDKLLKHTLYNDKWTTVRREILKQRNHSLVEKMKSLFTRLSTFVVVDAVHLASDFGVLSLLKKEGFRVEPVIAPATQAVTFVKEIKWKKINTEQNFSFHIPGEPVFDEQLIESELGMLKTCSYRMYASEGDPNIFYGITYTDYPAHIVHSDYKDMWDDIFNNSGDALIMSLNGGEFVEESNVSLKGYPGRETLARFEQGEKIIKFRSYLVGNRMFILQVITTRDRISNKFIGKFFDSFFINK